jgi:hypothetical protein
VPELPEEPVDAEPERPSPGPLESEPEPELLEPELPEPELPEPLEPESLELVALAPEDGSLAPELTVSSARVSRLLRPTLADSFRSGTGRKERCGCCRAGENATGDLAAFTARC